MELYVYFLRQEILIPLFFYADRNDPLERKLDTGLGGIIVAKFPKGEWIDVRHGDGLAG